MSSTASRPARARDGAAGARLDLRTLLHSPEKPRGGPWLVTYYPDAKEATVTQPRPRADAPTGKGGDHGENVARATRRAKGECRRHARANGLCYLWVLTYAGAGCHDWRAMVAHLRQFFEAVADLKVAMLVVPEWHPHGHGLHLNVALGRRVPWQRLVAAWPHGSVQTPRRRCAACRRAKVRQCRHVRPGWRKQDAGLVASYVAGYVTKGANAENGEIGKPGAVTGIGRPARGHRYFVSQGHDPDRYQDAFETLDEACAALVGYFRCEPPRVWGSWCGRGALPGAPPSAWFDFWPRRRDGEFRDR